MEVGGSVDGTNLAPVEVGSLSQYSEGAIHPRWCRISEPSTVGTRPSLFRSIFIHKQQTSKPCETILHGINRDKTGALGWWFGVGGKARFFW